MTIDLIITLSALFTAIALLYSGEYRNLIVQETPPSEDGDAS